MVAFEAIQSSNARIKLTLPPGLVAVFVGGTNGVGETTVKQFAHYAPNPRVYIIGRSQECGDRIVSECQAINPSGTFIFLQRETSLLRNVDALCTELKSKESVINILFLTIGALEISKKTEEGLHYATALTLHARSHIISSLLPTHIRPAPHLRRIVTVFGATFEGAIATADFQGGTLGRIANQAHLASLLTLDLEAHQNDAPEVGFVHAFPGAVESGIARGEIGWLMRGLKTVWGWLGEWVHVPLVEAGDRHLFLCTSARFKSREGGDGDGVPIEEGVVEVARGTDGRVGSGVYSIDALGESAGTKVERKLEGFRKEGLVEWVRENMRDDVKRALAAGEGGLGQRERSSHAGLIGGSREMKESLDVSPARPSFGQRSQDINTSRA